MNKKLALILSFFIVFLIALPHLAGASNFTSSYLRLDKQTPSAPLSGTVCASASSAGAGTESKVIVTFPVGFGVSSNASDWTTSISNLPSGSVNWPGIGSVATSVSGQSVTFSGTDLTSTSLYCFNFTGAASTTGATGDNQNGTITTEDSSNSTIDSTTYALSIVNNNQIDVTASIDPQVSDLPITISSSTTGEPFPQNTQIDYTITYGSNTTGTIPLTIQAQWSQGTIGSSPTPSVDILDYVVGSATNAYGSTPAVIDTINRTITWTISSFPGGTTGQTVTFSLKTNSAYTGSEIVSFDVSARAISGATVTPDQTLTQTYLYNAGLTPTPSPTSAPSAGASPTPTPSSGAITQPAFYFSQIDIRSISQSDANIFVSTSKKATLNLTYGTSIKSLKQSIKTLLFETENTINLANLEPNTIYYFKIIAKDENGNSITSDIFTFKTAAISPVPNVNKQSLVVTSMDNILLNSSQFILTVSNPNYIVVIPTNTVFTLQFSLDKIITLKSIKAIVRNRRILGFTTIANAQAGANFVDLIEVQPGIYTGKLISPTPGQYEVYVRLMDYNGNVLEQKLMDLNVTNKFTVLTQGTKEPVENARVFLSLYNQTTRIYSPISSQTLPIDNPTYSDPKGLAAIVLPQGKYRADVEAIGYKPQSVEFAIDTSSTKYPIVYLEKQPFNLVYIAQYYSDIISDSINASQIYLKSLAASSRLFNLVTGGALIVFVFIVFVSFSARTHVPLLSIPYFFISKIYLLLLKTNSPVILGKVVDEETKIPVSRANVYFFNPENQKVSAHLKTNKLGEFYFRVPEGKTFKISVMKENYISSPYFEHSEAKNSVPFEISIKRGKTQSENIFKIIFVYIEDLLGVLLEAIIVMDLIFEVYLTSTFGFVKLVPFLVLTTMTIILYMLYIYRPRIRE